MDPTPDDEIRVLEILPGLWIWRVRHPGWSEEADWQPVVTTTVADVGDHHLVLDPLAPSTSSRSVWDRLDARPPSAVAILIPDHLRPSLTAGGPRTSLDLLASRYHCEAYGSLGIEPPERPTTELRDLEAGTELPGGFHVLEDPRGGDERPVWIPEHRALVFADSMTERKGVLRKWTMGDIDGRATEALRNLLDLPFERIVISHGEPVHSRAAYERAIELPPWPAGPLHLFSWKGDLDVVKQLVERGADLGALDEHEESYLCANGIPGHTALDWAYGARQSAVIEYLESKGAPSSPRASRH